MGEFRTVRRARGLSEREQRKRKWDRRPKLTCDWCGRADFRTANGRDWHELNSCPRRPGGSE